MSDRDWEAWDQQIAEEREKERRRARHEHRARVRAELIGAGAPTRMLDLKPTRTEAIVQLSHQMAQRGRGRLVILAGGVGTGKTSAALHWLLASRGGVWFATAKELARSSDYDTPLWRRANNGVLDDLGTEHNDRSGAFAGRLDELISHYTGQQKRLVITTNLLRHEFAKRYRATGGRIASRLAEAGAWVTVQGPDMRQVRR